MREPSAGSTIGTSAIVDSSSRIGQRVQLGPLSYVGPDCALDDDVVVGARATIVGSPAADNPGIGTHIGSKVVIGAAAVVQGPLRIGRGAVVRPGAVVSEDVPAHAVVAGNPAEVVGYTADDASIHADFVAPPSMPGESVEIAGCTLVRLPEVIDLRGSLTFAEIGSHLPYEPKRMFIVYDVPSQKIRGSHAHYELHEFILAVGGKVTVTVDNGLERGQIRLDEPTLALHLRPLTWTTQYAYDPGAALLVLASHPYEDADYIRDYDDYRRIIHG